MLVKERPVGALGKVRAGAPEFGLAEWFLKSAGLDALNDARVGGVRQGGPLDGDA